MTKAGDSIESGPREWTPRKPRHPVGRKIVLRQEVDRYPDFVAAAGLTGMIVMFEPDLIRVRMDQPIKGAEQWDHEVHWYGDDVKGFEKDVRILGGRS